MKNIFLEDKPMDTFDTFMKYDAQGRKNLGDQIPVLIYRMLEYSLKFELQNRFDKETQVEVFRAAGRSAGKWFAKNCLNLDQSLDAFVSELQQAMQTYKIGVLRIESVDETSGKIVLTVSEDADCSGLPVLGETVCNYDEGFIAGILSKYTGKDYEAIEVDCWATGNRVCRFHANVCE